MYIIKIKGASDIADFVQIRDENFFIVDLIKISNFDKKLKVMCPNSFDFVRDKVFNAKYGEIIQINCENENN